MAGDDTHGAQTRLSEGEMEMLAKSLVEDRCMVLLGPDVANGTPWETSRLIGQLLGPVRVDDRDRAAASSSLPFAAQLYHDDKRFGRNLLCGEVERFYRGSDRGESSLHDDLAQLPVRYYITSCHDQLLSAAMERAGRTPKTLSYKTRGTADVLIEHEPTHLKPLIYQLYGSPTHHPSVVITETDLLDFLVAIVNQSPPLPHDLRSELNPKEKTFLFLGFGIRYWYLRVIFHVLGILESANASYALEEPLPGQRATCFYENKKIHVVNQDLGTFVRDLRHRVRSWKDVQNSSPKQRPPKVFLSYSHKDAHHVSQLKAALEERGLRTFRDQPDKAARSGASDDKRSLAVGDKWREEIKHQICKEADYFLLVHTRNVTDKAYDNEVVWELKTAMEREKSWVTRRTRFIFPAALDDADLIDDIKDNMQAIRLKDDQDIQALVDSIQSDFQRRHEGAPTGFRG